MVHPIFKADYPLMIAWLKAKGYSGSLNEMFLQYFRSLIGGSPGGYLNDLIAIQMRSLGLSGSVGDMVNTFFYQKTGIINSLDAQRKFFGDSTNSFVLSNGNDSYAKLLLHLDGTNGSTTFTDSSSNTVTVTPAGSAQISTAQSKFGGASGLFTVATSDYVSFPDSTNFQVGSGAFTIDCWIRPTSVASNEWWFGDLDGSGVQKSLMMASNVGVFTVNLTFSDLSQANQTHQTAISAGAWQHVAVVSNGTTITIYLNGVAGNSPQATSGKAIQANQSSGSWFIGKGGSYAGVYFGGHIDEFRFSKGIARWTTNFTPPTSAYS